MLVCLFVFMFAIAISFIYLLKNERVDNISDLTLANINALAAKEAIPPYQDWQPCYTSCSTYTPGIKIEIRCWSSCKKVKVTSWVSDYVCKM